MTRRGKIGLGLVLGGLALAGVGVGIAVSRRKKNLAGEIPAVGVTRKNGMTLTHRRAAKLSIEQRAGALQDLVWGGVQDPTMRKLALDITSGCEARDGLCEARAVDAWMRKNVRYTGDVAPVKLGKNGPVEAIDLFQAPRRTVEFGGGDCDDQSVLAATLLALNGIPSKFRITSPSLLGGWSHIYVVAGLPKEHPSQWVAVDATLPSKVCPDGQCFGHEVGFAKNKDFPPYTKEIPT